MIIGQAIFQLTATFTLYFAGDKILNYDLDDPQQRLQLDTLIFNAFVWMQIFNEFNNRRLDNKFNIFEGIHRNQFFIFINLLMVGLQIAIIFVGGAPFAITPGGLDSTQWAISVVLALMCLPWAVLVRLFPDAWFAVIAGIVGKPFVMVYLALGRVWTLFMRVFKFNRSKGGREAEEAASECKTEPAVNAPAIVVNEPSVEEVVDVERGPSLSK